MLDDFLVDIHDLVLGLAVKLATLEVIVAILHLDFASSGVHRADGQSFATLAQQADIDNIRKILRNLFYRGLGETFSCTGQICT